MPKTNIIIDDVQYDNYEEYVWFRNRELVQQLFPWLTPVPQVLAVIITALAFGILGGVTRITKQLAFESEITIANAKIITLPVLGMLSGVIMLGLTFIVPTILTSGDQELRPTTLVFLTLFAGLFAKRFYDWLNSIFDIIFPNQKPKDS